MTRQIILKVNYSFDLTDSLLDYEKTEGKVPDAELEQWAKDQMDDHDFNHRVQGLMDVEVNPYTGRNCPHCHSENIESGNTEFDVDICWQCVICLDCKTKWDERYNLVGYDLTETTTTTTNNNNNNGS